MSKGQRIKRAFLDTEEGQILYRICGQGEALILLHRSPRSSEEFSAIMPILAQQRLVIAMDLFGYGDSDRPSRIYSLEDHAQTVFLLFDELGISTCSLLGNHTGAYVAGEFAAAYPQRVEKLILANIDYFTPEEAANLSNYYDEGFLIKKDGSNLLTTWSFLLNYTNSLQLNYRCFLDQLKCSSGPVAVANYGPKLKQRFALIQCPTLIISGTEDEQEIERLGLAKAENRQVIVQAISQAQRIDLAEGSFCMMQQIPEKIAQITLNFLNKKM